MNDSASTDMRGAFPPLRRTSQGEVDLDSIPDVVEWFLDYDQRVGVIRHPKVEEVFQWKQEQSKKDGEEVFIFNRAEDRLAIGIIQALAQHASREQLHSWISQLLNALDAASKANETAAETYKLNLGEAKSTVMEAEKIPFAGARREFLLNCWIEALCTAEARVLGWLYREFYAHPFRP
jgi:hypothetical protein